VSKLSYTVIIRAITTTALLLAAMSPMFRQASVHAQSNADTDATPAITIGPDQDREFEKRAQSLEKQLICPICPGETLDQSFVQISQDMKRILREKLRDGQDEGQIKDFFADRYGPGILAAPPRSGFNLVIWVVPPIGVAIGIVGLFLVMRQMRRDDASPVATGVGERATETDLTNYLAEVDRDLALGEAGDQMDLTPDNDIDQPGERSGEN
jgi:cytochrome c-type biogenesis protein CcmH|tara:strand:- start:1161 stop:1796 length:636 start_codon:yes stop_codon:yes gene_type:complete